MERVRPRSASGVTSEMLPSVGVEGDVIAAVVGEDGDGEAGAEAFFSCHSFFFSLAQLPQELR